jgi:hypothetical protein
MSSEAKLAHDDPLHTAYHEASHAVMDIRLGNEPDILVVEGAAAGSYDGGGSEDHVEFDVLLEALERDPHLVVDARKRVLTKLAGWAGAKAAGFGRPAHDCRVDFNEAGMLLRAWKLGSLKRWKRRALAIMRRPENKRAVAELAVPLHAKGQLRGDEILRIVKLTDPLAGVEHLVAGSRPPRPTVDLRRLLEEAAG